MSTALKKSTPEQRQQMGAFILSVEARRNKAGQLMVYRLPSADGGGAFEVAGINDRYHPNAAMHLAGLIERGLAHQAEAEAIVYLLNYTDVVRLWTEHPAIEAFLRDCAFNRGPKGALRILQLALFVADDGKMGPKTRRALVEGLNDAAGLLKRLRHAREQYERRVAPPVGARAKFWKGLVNRWNKAEAFARGML